jgi:hypothetical protein
MITVGGIISILLLAIFTGKRTHKMTLGVYVFTTFLALALVCMILYDMYTLSYPIP